MSRTQIAFGVMLLAALLIVPPVVIDLLGRVAGPGAAVVGGAIAFGALYTGLDMVRDPTRMRDGKWMRGRITANLIIASVVTAIIVAIVGMPPTG